MSGNELRDLESLLTSVLADPSGFGQRLVEQVVDRLGTVSVPGTGPPRTVPGTLADEQEEAQDRQILLAAALGACECWGSDPECRSCGGDGMSGWHVPDAQLYEEFVTPAISRLAQAARRHTAGTTEGTDDEHHLAGQQ